MNFSLKLSALFILISSIAFSQRGKDGIGNITGTSIVNAYTTLSNNVTANTTNTITVANVSSFSAGDLVLIIQMSGTWANYASADSISGWNDPTSSAPGDTSYGKIMAYNGAGVNEMLQVNSVNSGANTITFDCQITKSFKASGKTQIVRVPRYSSLDISATGIITCPHWDRTLGYGGVVALEVQGNTNIASGGRIDASGLGFRGGGFWFKNASAANSDVWGCYNPAFPTFRRNEAGNKGESIAGDTNVYANEAALFGKGAIANGGGGGNAINAGGGGGANAGLTNKYFGGIGNIDTTTNTNYIQAWTLENTAYPTSGVLSLWRANTNSGGGRGGYTYSNDIDNPLTQGPNNGNWGTSDNRRSVGGRGGRPLDYTNNQLYLGGGGGSGDGENYYQGAGGDGGGIIYFMSYGTISGAGQIVSNGANGSNSITNVTRPGDAFAVLGRDGAGGGGGGGAIMINSVGAISGISILANGGNGGNQEMRNNGFSSVRMAYGPGGGGGGGFVNIPSGNTVTVNTNGGINGIVDYLSGTESCLIDDNFPPNGATKGGPGTNLTTVNPFYISTTGATICSGNTAAISATLNGTAPNPVTIGWYTDSIGGNPFNTGTTYTTPVLTTTTIYWVGTCPGTYREKVTVTVNTAPAAPVATTPINYCLNATASALSATATSGNTIVWYDAASGGNVLSQPLTPSTSSVGSTSYFAAQSNGSCTGARTQVDVVILALPNTPNVTTPVSYCQNTVASAISATPSGGGNTILYWGTAATGGSSSGTATVPSTASVGSTSYYVSETNGTCASTRVPIVVNVNAIPATPSVTDTVSYCQNQVASQLTPNTAGYNWYTVATGGVSGPAPTPSTASVGVTTYYVSQTISLCESLRDSVKVVVNTSYTAPVASNVNICNGATTSALTPNGVGYNWYTASSGGTASASITPSSNTIGIVSYYVSQGSGTCESPRIQVDVITNALPNAPSVTSPVNYCLNETASPISATAGAPTSDLLYWGTDATGGTFSFSAPTPSTSTVGTTTYYVSENNGTCESTRAAIVVNVNAIPAAPSVTDTVSYCQNQAASALTPNGANYNWYTAATGGSATAAPTPVTSSVGVTTYYVSETQNGCESLRDSVKVVVNTSFSAPSASNVSNCIGSTANVLSPNGTGYNWYTASTGGTPSATITPSTVTTGTVSYFVSQGSGSCESPRTQVDVVTLALPNAPSVTSPVSYCLNETATAISATASGAGNTLLYWGTDATGGTSNLTANIPSTTATGGSTTYYVSENDGTCESPRASIVVNVNAIPATPNTTDTVSYCQNQTAIALTPSGANYNWYTTATGGVSTAAPTPITSAVGVTTYYVSETQNGCESLRDSVKVIVNTTFTAPTASNTSNCFGSTANILTPNGTGYNWYTASTGGTPSTTITPATNTVGTISYFVSQGSGSCESPRTQVDVITHALPNKPTGTDVTYCINEPASSLIATGSGTLNWYTVSTGGTSSLNAPTPVTNTVGNTDYYVSQTDANTCESLRDTITVSVINLQSAPSSSNITYCQNDNAAPLTATGTSQLNWWGTNATGGTSSTTATIPSTTILGPTTYYVSQGTGACESPRTSIVVTVNPKPISTVIGINLMGCQDLLSSFTSNAPTGTTVLWNFGDGTSSTNTNTTHLYTTPGTYDVSLTATNSFGCIDSVKLVSYVTVYPNANAQFTISPSSTIEIGQTVSFVGDTSVAQAHNWDFADPASGVLNYASNYNPSHLYSEEGTYCVQLSTITTNGCVDTAEVCIQVMGQAFIEIPNVFTPNGDNINDFFMVKSSGITTMEANIYDRWGILVYTWNGATGSWDGKNKSGNMSSNGVYYYIIKATDFKNETTDYKGHLQLIDSK